MRDPGPWQSVTPREAFDWLSHITAPWCIAGGWALDLFLDRHTRPHADMDVAILRSDVPQFYSGLSGWEFFSARHGVLTRLPASVPPELNVNQLWCRPPGATLWALELMLETSEQETWIYRRDADLRRPLREVIHWSEQGIPYIAPEVQLLYKARSVRPKDQADFETVTPELDSAARAWLARALSKTCPGHAWIGVLDEMSAI